MKIIILFIMFSFGYAQFKTEAEKELFQAKTHFHANKCSAKDIMVAYSGGGVRAQVGSISALEALKLLGLFDRVKLIGGLSGGSWGALTQALYDYDTDKIKSGIATEMIKNKQYGQMKTFAHKTCDKACYTQWKNDIKGNMAYMPGINQLNIQSDITKLYPKNCEKPYIAFQMDIWKGYSVNGLTDTKYEGAHKGRCTVTDEIHCNTDQYPVDQLAVINKDTKRAEKWDFWDSVSFTSVAWQEAYITGLSKNPTEVLATNKDIKVFRANMEQDDKNGFFRDQRNKKFLRQEYKTITFTDAGGQCNYPMELAEGFNVRNIIVFDYSASAKLGDEIDECSKFYKMKPLKEQYYCGFNLEEGDRRCDDLVYSRFVFKSFNIYVMSFRGFWNKELSTKFPTTEGLGSPRYFKDIHEIGSLWGQLLEFYINVIEKIKKDHNL